MVIAHLYSDLLNLYGNDGNVKILAQKLEELGCDVTVERPSVGDEMNWAKYDLVFVGSGTEKNQEMALADLCGRKAEVTKAIDAGLVFLALGNSVDMFGEGLYGAYGTDRIIDGLGVLPYRSVWTEPRVKGDIRRKSIFLESGNDFLGFENHNYTIDASSRLNLDVAKMLHLGTTSVVHDQEVRVNNFFGSYAEGPALVRNPEFCRNIIQLLVGDKADKLDMLLEERAYDNFIKVLDEYEKK